jgi:membrane associated rhomboid family serine protease
MIFPIGDTQVIGGHKPIVSYGLIGINLVVFIFQMLTPGNLVCELSVIPQVVLEGQDWHTLISSMFLHGGFMHLAGNMLFLWIFADNIEAKIGSFSFFLFYILGGLVASFAHIYFDGGGGDLANCCIPCENNSLLCGLEGIKPCNGYIPSLGASGAISAVMGAYLVMFPKSQIKVLVIFLFKSVHITAWLFLIFWFGQQLISGIGSTFYTNDTTSAGVAWWAHIGGFVIGLLGGFIFKTNWTADARNNSV